jgi:hypothetical protein
MKLAEVVGQYVTHKQSMGMRFCTEERTLKAFCRAIGNIAMTEIQRDRIVAGRIKVHHSGSNQNAPPWTAAFLSGFRYWLQGRSGYGRRQRPLFSRRLLDCSP